MAQGPPSPGWRGSVGLRLIVVLAVLTAAGCGGSTASPSAAVSAVPSATQTATASPTATPAPRARFVPTGSMRYQRQNASATLLQDGRVLIAGGSLWMGSGLLASAELYDPRSGRFTPTGSMITAREEQTATLLMDGRVLIVGGTGCLHAGPCGPRVAMTTEWGPVTSAELYDPTTGTFSRTGSMISADSHTATRLADGRVLIIDGYGKSAQLYDPASGRFVRTGSSLFGTSNGQRTATLLPDGRVFVTGVASDTATYYGVRRAEFYDPATGKFTAAAAPLSTIPQTATLLADGRVLLCESGFLETYDQATGAYASLGSFPSGAGGGSTATALSDGRVLFAGGWGAGEYGSNAVATAGLYDVAGGPSVLDPMSTARTGHTATLLQDGSVLIAGGGAAEYTALAAAELFIPEGVSFTLPPTLAPPTVPETTPFAPTGEPITRVGGHTATLLLDGRVLIAGGEGTNYINEAATLYDPGTRQFSPTGSMATARTSHTATLLPDGRVLIIGGYTCGRDREGWCVSKSVPTASAELYEPRTGTFSKTGSMSVARAYATATLLPDGRVLVAGGLSTSSKANRSADLYDPATGHFSPTGASPLNFNQRDATATLLPNGKVLLTGTTPGGPGAETYDPQTGAFTAIQFELPSGTPPAEYNRQTYDRTAPQTATLLKDGRVLLFEGGRLEMYDWRTGSFASAGFDYPPGQWSYPKATLLEDGRVLFTGGDLGGLFEELK